MAILFPCALLTLNQVSDEKKDEHGERKEGDVKKKRKAERENQEKIKLGMKKR